MTIEEAYWLKITQPVVEKKEELTKKEKAHRHYLEHKNYYKSKALFYRNRKKNEN